MDEWMAKRRYIYTEDSAIKLLKTERNLALCTEDRPGRYCAERSKTDRERRMPYGFIYMWNLRNKIDKQDRNKVIDSENILRGTGWDGG